jgi:hypothetical protein
LSSETRTVPMLYDASGFELALFTGEERFGGTSAAPSPPARLDSASSGIELDGFSAALYLRDTVHP